MRIITGSARGTILETPKNDGIRPTLERVKENYFNAIHFDVADKKVLDLFAGTGQLGLEALSRGAKEAVFVDSSNENISLIKRNAQKCKLYENCKVVCCDWSEYINMFKKQKDGENFGMVFIDPPYGTKTAEEAVKKLIISQILTDDAILVVETDREELELDEDLYDSFATYKTFRYGTVYITIIRMKEEETESEEV